VEVILKVGCIAVIFAEFRGGSSGVKVRFEWGGGMARRMVKGGYSIACSPARAVGGLMVGGGWPDSDLLWLGAVALGI